MLSSDSIDSSLQVDSEDETEPSPSEIPQLNSRFPVSKSMERIKSNRQGDLECSPELSEEERFR